ncbi:citrate:H+ symporter [Haloterrigena sp. SYSU A121-1]|uniref:Citrate:H+ symporter n=1 Tax=Haloterrigena gelatinilytica TaxID=2741724 RepID=A0A8J8KDQ8_9EURY|nr:citrate:proton symporter [Haloterrigena gelatinilytica]NUB89846.1 citrate:H+ symporter [Haloterrigena gelatinilytica]
MIGTGVSLGIIGYGAILLILLLVIRKRMYVIPTLIVVPVLAALVAGFSFEEIGSFAEEGLQGIVGITAMFAFAVWYFSIMRDNGLFDPFVARIVDNIIGRPALLTVGTVGLAMMTHLDGAGATTMLITIPALLPLYDALDVDRRILAALVALTAGTMNMLPWGGQVVRGVAAIEPATVSNIFNPMIPAQAAGMLSVFGISAYFGRRIRRDLDSVTAFEGVDEESLIDEAIDGREIETDWKWVFNLLLTIAVLGVLIAGVTSPEVSFMIGVVVALAVNVPDYERQKEVLESYAPDVMTYVGILFAAGVLIGVLEESGMITEMANILVLLIPDALGAHLPVVVAIVSLPARLLFSPDAFYFGVLPVLAETSAAYGHDPVAVVRASLVGQTVGFPVSPFTGATYLLIGLAGVELGEHIKFTLPLMVIPSSVILVVGLLLGAIPL